MLLCDTTNPGYKLYALQQLNMALNLTTTLLHYYTATPLLHYCMHRNATTLYATTLLLHYTHPSVIAQLVESGATPL